MRNTAVISEDQLRNTAYEYIPSQDVEQHNLQTLQTRDALQAAMESAEVDKIELLRAPEDHNNIIFENSDSNSQSQSHVRIFQKKKAFFNALLQHLKFVLHFFYMYTKI